MNKREQALREYIKQPLTEEEKAILEGFKERKKDCAKIKELRQSTRMSQSEFAQYFGISVRNIQEWEQGRKNPPPYLVGLLERILKLES